MKFIKAFLLILIVAASAVSSKIKRHQKSESHSKLQSKLNARFHNKNKDDGEGSWNTGYNCPGLQISLNGQTYSDMQKVYFKPTQIEQPANALDNLGIYFKFSTPPNAVLSQVLVAEPKSNTFYLPYRYISQNLEYVKDGIFSYKTLEGWVTNDAKKGYKFKIVLPYKIFGNYVTTDEAEKLAKLIKQRKDEAQSTIRASKRKALDAAVAFIAKKPLLEEVESTGNKAGSTKKANEKRIQELTAIMSKSKTDLQQLQKDADLFESSLNEKKTKIVDLNNQLISMGKEFDSLKENLVLLGNSSGITASKQKELKGLVDVATNDLASSLKDIGIKAPERLDAITKATDAVLTAKNQVTFSNNIDQISPQ